MDNEGFMQGHKAAWDARDKAMSAPVSKSAGVIRARGADGRRAGCRNGWHSKPKG